MSLSWKDGVATLLIAASGVIAYAKIKNFDWPLLASWRLPIIGILLLGFGTCIVVGSGVVPSKDGWTVTASVLGGLAFLLAIIGLIANSKLMFVMLFADMLALWAIATIHHMVMTAT